MGGVMVIEYDVAGLNEENRKFFYEMTPYISTHIGKISRSGEVIRIETQEEFREEVLQNCDR